MPKLMENYESLLRVRDLVKLLPANDRDFVSVAPGDRIVGNAIPTKMRFNRVPLAIRARYDNPPVLRKLGLRRDDLRVDFESESRTAVFVTRLIYCDRVSRAREEEALCQKMCQYRSAPASETTLDYIEWRG
jgi:hypothetical protein